MKGKSSMRNHEIGRSMIEIIAVLAIMGLLSLGGITGYSLSVVRTRANNLLNVAGQLSSMSIGGRTYASLADAGLRTSETGVNLSSDAAGKITITGLDKNSRLYSIFKTLADSYIIGAPACQGKKCTLILNFKQEN